MNTLLQLSKFAGAALATLLCIGILTRSDIKLIEGQESSIISALIPANDAKVNNTVNDSPAIAAIDEIPTNYRNKEIRPLHAEMPSRPTHTAKSEAIPARGSRPVASVDLETWLELNVTQTFLEAEKETIAPGVILATGLYFLQEGQGDMSMNAVDISEYLTEVRANASHEAKAHMKYIANSKSWFTGLKKAGFDGERIAKLFRRYKLDQYDQEMYNRFVRKKTEDKEYTRPGNTLTNKVEERNHNLAQAYNDYADQPETRKKLGLPSIHVPRPMAKSELSDGRKEALSFSAGESRTYKDARQFWAVLKEMIALEARYNSWEAYHNAKPKVADRAFRKRSNIMALGGVMRVTREEGA